jgi:hypothetical protein
MDAVEASKHMNRRAIAKAAREKYSLQSLSKLYDKAFMQIDGLRGEGWYSLD